MTRVVNSWDIFDTLLARKCVRPENIFAIVECISEFPDFAKHRISAGKLPYVTFIDLYNNFSNVTGCSSLEAERLAALELYSNYHNN